MTRGTISYIGHYMKERKEKMKNFYITYYSQKDKKTITRRGEHDDKSRFGENKKTGVGYYVYKDLDAYGYRTATEPFTIKERVA